MPPRVRRTSGYRGVRACPSGMFYAEIRSGDVRLGLGTFETAHARAYDAAAWRLGRLQAQMNFSNARAREQAQDPVPPSRLITDEDCRVQRRQERRLLVAEADEYAMTEWRQRFPEDVARENEFWAQRRVQRAADRTDRRQWKALAIAQCELEQTSTFDDIDPRWNDAFLSLDYTTEEEDDNEK
ncbi:uncharacterized protein [Aegilops tauschii subsp. strangulata]|uniref:uncharacterized protein n=1 Tax=Aegilops tauschii subsp. strangulata TaxID=200361 RepID=UPI00098BC420|nr:ethylene-responsive transcription factor 2-like [Aegilops tauschii subsp. strangulata]